MIVTDRRKITLIDNLRRARREKGLTQLEAAKILKVSRGTIGMIESYHSLPTFKLFFKICDLYGVKPCDMLKEETI